MPKNFRECFPHLNGSPFVVLCLAACGPELAYQHFERTCPDGSGSSLDRPSAAPIFERSWDELLDVAGRQTVITPAPGAAIVWDETVTIDWSATPDLVSELGDCAEPAVSARVRLAAESSLVSFEADGVVWIAGDDPRVVSWTFGRVVPTPPSWVPALEALTSEPAAETVNLNLSFLLRNGDGRAPAPAWEVRGASPGGDQRVFDHGTWHD